MAIPDPTLIIWFSQKNKNVAPCYTGVYPCFNREGGHEEEEDDDDEWVEPSKRGDRRRRDRNSPRRC